MAHVYDIRGQCIYCSMHKVNVDTLSHNCTPMREAIADAKLAQMTVKLEKEAEDGK